MAGSGRGPGQKPGAQSWQALTGRPAPAQADPVAQLYEKGMALHRRGEVREAGLVYQQVLAMDPQHIAASHALGMALHQMNRHEPAERLVRRALDSQPANPVFLSNLGLILIALGRPAEAIEAYRKALKRDPDAAQIHSNLGVALLLAGRVEEAGQSQRRAIRHKADFAPAHANLGRALAAQGRPDEARTAFAAALALQPAYVEAHVWLGDLLLGTGDAEGAVGAYREAARLRPDHAGAHLGLARGLGAAGRHEGAADNYRAAAYIEPSDAAYAGLAAELVALGKPEEAAAAYETAIGLAPADAAIIAARDSLLLGLGRAPAAVPDRPLSDLEREEAQFRMAVAATPGNAVALGNLASALAELGRLPEAIGYYRQALAADPEYLFAWSEMLFAINYLGGVSTAEMTAEARRYGAAVAARIPARTAHGNDRTPDRRLRVGLVSADLHAHPVGRFLDATLAAIDPERIELYAYSSGTRPDEMTQRLKSSVAVWRDVAQLDHAALAAAIVDDAIDILVDLSGHSARNRLLTFARKPAPVAVTWLGYFATTGLATMDYVLATDRVIPADEEGQWTETPWRLPETYICFSTPTVAAPLVPPPALANGYVTFGSANNISKLNDETVACWADVLKAVPDSRLVLRAKTLGDDRVASGIRVRFAAHGIASERLDLEPSVPDYGQHLARYNRVDIALDPFPYAGGTTTVEALWMGVPVLTRKGDRYVAHMGENILHNVGLPEWIAADTADYVAKAKAFAADSQALAALRRDLRHRLAVSPILDAPRFARHLEMAFRGMWQDWLEKSA